MPAVERLHREERSRARGGERRLEPGGWRLRAHGQAGRVLAGQQPPGARLGRPVPARVDGLRRRAGAAIAGSSAGCARPGQAEGAVGLVELPSSASNTSRPEGVNSETRGTSPQPTKTLPLGELLHAALAAGEHARRGCTGRPGTRSSALVEVEDQPARQLLDVGRWRRCRTAVSVPSRVAPGVVLPGEARRRARAGSRCACPPRRQTIVAAAAASL